MIEKCEHFYFELGQALATIADKKLYRETHDNFDDYCRERFDFGDKHGYRVIKDYKAVAELSPIGEKKILPATESQARELASIPNLAQRQAVWEQVVTAAVAGDDSPKITAQIIAAKKVEILGPKKTLQPKSLGKHKLTKDLGESDLDAAVRKVRVLTAEIVNSWPATKFIRTRFCEELKKLAREFTIR